MKKRNRKVNFEKLAKEVGELVNQGHSSGDALVLVATREGLSENESVLLADAFEDVEIEMVRSAREFPLVT